MLFRSVSSHDITTTTPVPTTTTTTTTTPVPTTTTTTTTTPVPTTTTTTTTTPVPTTTTTTTTTTTLPPIQWITPSNFNVNSDATSYSFNALNATRYAYISGQLPGSVVLNEDGTLTGTFSYLVIIHLL